MSRKQGSMKLRHGRPKSEPRGWVNLLTHEAGAHNDTSEESGIISQQTAPCSCGGSTGVRAEGLREEGLVSRLSSMLKEWVKMLS